MKIRGDIFKNIDQMFKQSFEKWPTAVKKFFN